MVISQLAITTLKDRTVETMKEIYIRVTANTRIGYDIIRTKVLKEYKEYEIAIVKYGGRYSLTDIKTGLNCGKWFNKLKDAKSFMEHTEEVKFRNWFEAVERARKTERYKHLEIKVR